LLPKYGVMALTTNYPNLIDIAHKKSGGGIWLHGTNQPARLLNPYETRGCVVASNKNIFLIAINVNLELTPIIIVDKIRYVSAKTLKIVRKNMLELILKWKNAWANKNIEQYISFYSKNFFSASGMNRSKWKKNKMRFNKKYSFIKIAIKNINIFRHDNYVIVTFKQKYMNNYFTSECLKRLYFTKKMHTWKIIGEEARQIPVDNPIKVLYKYFKDYTLATSGNAYKRENWLYDKNTFCYVVQLFGTRSETKLISFIKTYGLINKVSYYRTIYKGKSWYVLVYGNYESMAEAKNAMEKLPKNLKKASPWIRKVRQLREAVIKAYL